MPRGDRTGPFGEGPGTGRQMGYCAGNTVPGCAGTPGLGRGGAGLGPKVRGRGGRGYRHRFYATGIPFRAHTMAEPEAKPGRNEEVELLRNEAEYLRGKLADIERRLGELETT